MARSRLSTALSEGFLTLPQDGPIVVMRPPSAYDLADLPRDRTTVVHGFRPDADYWAAAGYEVARAAASAALSVVVVPRSKRLARAMVTDASRLGGTVVVDGARTDGIDSLFRDIRGRIGDLDSLTKAHGRMFAFAPRAGLFDDWADPGPQKDETGVYRQPGLFSEDRVDRGSRLLAEALPARIGPRVADLGGGWGFLSRHILERAGVETLDIVEAEANALDCARLNVTDPRARFHWADAREFTPDAPIDTVVMNPPFHTARKAEPSLGVAFIAAAARILTPQGEVWMVANRHLPYEAALRDAFATIDEVGGDPAFKIYRAARPIRARSRRR